jgi:hypothetical protein
MIQGHPCIDFKSSNGVPVNFQSPPNSKAVNFKNVWKIVENSEKYQTSFVGILELNSTTFM